MHDSTKKAHSTYKCLTQHASAEITTITLPLHIEIVFIILSNRLVFMNPYIISMKLSLLKLWSSGP